MTNTPFEVAANVFPCPRGCAAPGSAQVFHTRQALGFRFRKRKCAECGERWITVEVPAADLRAMVTALEAARVYVSHIMAVAPMANRIAFSLKMVRLRQRIGDAES